MSSLKAEKKKLRKMYDNLIAIENEMDLYSCGRTLLAEINPGLVARHTQQGDEMRKQLELCKNLEGK